MDIIKQQEEREKFQAECVKLSLEYPHLLITAATGVGKGKAVMQCIASSSSSKKWLIVVPEIIQTANYVEDMIKHGMADILYPKIEAIICYASLPNYKGMELNLALNECHHLSKYKWDIADTVKFDQIISDSATVPSKVKARLFSLCPYHQYKLPLNEAIERGILPPPEIRLIKVELNPSQRKEYNKIESQYSKYQKLADKIGYKKWITTKLNRIGLERKQYLSHVKTPIAKELLRELEGKRLICYTGSIEQCNELGGEYAIHSGKKASINKKLVKSFNEGDIEKLFMNKMGREGMNFEDLDITLIIQLGSGNDDGLQFIQTTGRGMRALSPLIYLLYVNDSQDKIFLNKALTNIDKQYIKNI